MKKSISENAEVEKQTDDGKAIYSQGNVLEDCGGLIRAHINHTTDDVEVLECGNGPFWKDAPLMIKNNNYASSMTLDYTVIPG